MTAERTVEEPVRVVDNGIRSFIPPTYCFELRNEAGGIVATVSQVVMTDSTLTDFGLLAALRRDDAQVVGSITSYDPGASARRPGARFTVTRVIAP
ncbi:hypothetical protein FE633_14935 [Streptomyces montanus]|uniref:Uncharacterized protein n=1 Tax=Streptomyces montanus TaxID=2580423 RepID=A0A5R9FTG6_9ACTN|nr:hypothetical protein [Streptomyces montanus]TLS45366.1 hypothetical protein FE633_14935 [Streptomyces montanus]